MIAGLFKRDRADIARADYEAGHISRRRFLEICAWVGVAPAVLTAKGARAEQELVICNWGGDAINAYYNNWGKPFEAAQNVKVSIDGSGPFEGKIKAMVDENNVIWDVVDTDLFTGIGLGKRGYLERIDYSVVDKNKVPPGMAVEFGIMDYSYSYVLAYDAEKFGDDPPTSWADMWNFDKYPGGRTMWKYALGAVEPCLLADGVAADALYPIDVGRALDAAAKLGDNVIYWDSGASSQQMFLDGEVVMGAIWHTRASVLERDTKGRITWTWNDHIYCPAAWNIVKNNPAGAELANAFIASAQDPRQQIGVLHDLGNGPANPAAHALMTPEELRIDPGSPENFPRAVVRDEMFYSDNYDAVLEAWLDGIS